jgi:hypothetical protein
MTCAQSCRRDRATGLSNPADNDDSEEIGSQIGKHMTTLALRLPQLRQGRDVGCSSLCFCYQPLDGDKL